MSNTRMSETEAPLFSVIWAASQLYHNLISTMNLWRFLHLGWWIISGEMKENDDKCLQTCCLVQDRYETAETLRRHGNQVSASPSCWRRRVVIITYNQSISVSLTSRLNLLCSRLSDDVIAGFLGSILPSVMHPVGLRWFWESDLIASWWCHDWQVIAAYARDLKGKVV